MRACVRRLPILTILLLIGSSATATADPIQLISGNITYSRLNLAQLAGNAATGENINVQFGSLLLDSRNPDHACFGCAPGSTISLSQSESYPNQDDTTGADGSVLVGGVDYWLQSLDFQIDAGSVLLPDSSGTRVDLTSPFTFTGVIVGRSTGGETRTFNFLGSGTAATTFLNNEWFGTRYEFADPTPEPGTLLLLGGPAALALLRRRRSQAEA